MGGDRYLKVSAPKLSRFGKDIVLKIGRKRNSESVNDRGVCRTAWATLGLLKSRVLLETLVN